MSDHDEVRRRLEDLSDEELATIVRERDEEQWRPEVFDLAASILESRGVSVRDVLADRAGEQGEDEEQQDSADPRRLLTIARYMDPLLAQSDRLALEQAGIRSWVMNQGWATREDDISASLRIQPKDLDAALEILNAAWSSAADLPPELAEVHCPRCGSAEVEEVDEVVDFADSSSALSRSSEREVCFYRCTSCRHCWPA
jgi:hypothetical protein